jgi:antitoxin MazE
MFILCINIQKGRDIMNAVIQKWGNSNGIRLPKTVLDTANLQEKDKVEITAMKDKIVIKKAGYVHRTLKERLAGHIEEAYVVEEYDSSSVGEEKFWENE